MAENEEEEPVQQPPQFHVVILQADGELVAESFSELTSLVARLKSLLDRDVSVFPFIGRRLKISKPPFRYLMTPDDNIPLFELDPEKIEPDDTGYLGVDPAHLEDPPQIKQAPKAIDAADDFFDDKEDTSRGIFDGILPDPDS